MSSSTYEELTERVNQLAERNKDLALNNYRLSLKMEAILARLTTHEDETDRYRFQIAFMKTERCHLMQAIQSERGRTEVAEAGRISAEDRIDQWTAAVKSLQDELQRPDHDLALAARAEEAEVNAALLTERYDRLALRCAESEQICEDQRQAIASLAGGELERSRLWVSSGADAGSCADAKTAIDPSYTHKVARTRSPPSEALPACVSPVSRFSPPSSPSLTSSCLAPPTSPARRTSLRRAQRLEPAGRPLRRMKTLYFQPSPSLDMGA